MHSIFHCIKLHAFAFYWVLKISGIFSIIGNLAVEWARNDRNSGFGWCTVSNIRFIQFTPSYSILNWGIHTAMFRTHDRAIYSCYVHNDRNYIIYTLDQISTNDNESIHGGVLTMGIWKGQIYYVSNILLYFFIHLKMLWIFYRFGHEEMYTLCCWRMLLCLLRYTFNYSSLALFMKEEATDGRCLDVKFKFLYG